MKTFALPIKLFILKKCYFLPLIFVTSRNYAITFYKTLEDVNWHLGLEKLKKMTKRWEKTSESRKFFFQNVAKVHDIRVLKTVSLRLESMQLFQIL